MIDLFHCLRRSQNLSGARNQFKTSNEHDFTIVRQLQRVILGFEEILALKQRHPVARDCPDNGRSSQDRGGRREVQ